MEYGTSHLPGDFCGDVARLGDEGIDRAPEHIAAYRERHGSPAELCALCGVKRPIDSGGCRERSFDIDSAVDGADGLKRVGHEFPCLPLPVLSLLTHMLHSVPECMGWERTPMCAFGHTGYRRARDGHGLTGGREGIEPPTRGFSGAPEVNRGQPEKV